jgi:hypothetical protein
MPNRRMDDPAPQERAYGIDDLQLWGCINSIQPMFPQFNIRLARG